MAFTVLSLPEPVLALALPSAGDVDECEADAIATAPALHRIHTEVKKGDDPFLAPDGCPPG